MGPRPFGRGRQGQEAAERRQGRRFNGAATFRSRKALSMSVRPAKIVLLQWGRDLSVAEGGCTGRVRGARRPRFNGAATFRSRKARRPFPCSLHNSPLQWGRDLSVAEGTNPIPRGHTFSTLQWGRDLSVAEGTSRGCPDRQSESFNGAATFRSRKGARLGDMHGRAAASMGPRPFGRGRSCCFATPTTSPSSFNGAATFRSRKVMDR